MADEGTGWPRKVFLESTVLFRLGPRLENLEFAELLERRDSLGFELMVAEVSWREYLRRREKEIRDCVAKIRQCRADLAKHDQDISELEQAEQGVSAHLRNIREHFAAKAKSLQITIVPTPSIDVRALLEMSLTNDPPFEDSQSESGEKTKEKGLRDALIMLTVLDTIRDRPQDMALVITNDKRLTEAFHIQAPKHKTQVDAVVDLEAAVIHIDARIDEWYRDRLRREADEAKSMLLRYREQIAQRVQQIRELTDWDLGQGPLAGLGGEEREYLHIQELRSLDFDEVASALWKDNDQQKSRILFKIRCIAHVVATPQSLVLWDPTNFTVGGGKAFRKLSDLAVTPVQKDVPVTLYGDAEFERVNGGWQLVTIKVDRSLPEPEWKELWKQDIRLKK